MRNLFNIYFFVCFWSCSQRKNCNTDNMSSELPQHFCKFYGCFLVRHVKLWTQRNKTAVAYRQTKAERALHLIQFVVSKFI